MGRSAILGEQRNNYFCDVGCGRGEMGDSTYAITKSGLLCEFNNRRLLDKWVELRVSIFRHLLLFFKWWFDLSSNFLLVFFFSWQTTSANCLVVGEQHIFVGCADGIVRCFSPFTLQFVTTLPRTHYLGVDVAKGLSIRYCNCLTDFVARTTFCFRSILCLSKPAKSSCYHCLISSVVVALLFQSHGLASGQRQIPGHSGTDLRRDESQGGVCLQRPQSLPMGRHRHPQGTH